MDGACGKKPKVVLSSIHRALLRAHTYARAHTDSGLLPRSGDQQDSVASEPGLLIFDCLFEEQSVEFILGSHAGVAWCLGLLGFPSLGYPCMHVSYSTWVCFGGAANKVEALQETVKNVPSGSHPSV